MQNPHLMRNVTIHPITQSRSRLAPIVIHVDADALQQNMGNSNEESRRRRCCMKFLMIFIVFNLTTFLIWFVLRRLIR